MTSWVEVKQYQDITYKKADGMARIAFNRPEVRNAFRPETIDEMIDAFNHVWNDSEVGVILLTGEGPAHAFRLPDVAAVAVEPLRAAGKKCARSWRILPEVGADPRYPDLSLRDADAVAWWDAAHGR